VVSDKLHRFGALHCILQKCQPFVVPASACVHPAKGRSDQREKQRNVARVADGEAALEKSDGPRVVTPLAMKHSPVCLDNREAEGMVLGFGNPHRFLGVRHGLVEPPLLGQTECEPGAREDRR
jgi:hypothetical protein